MWLLLHVASYLFVAMVVVSPVVCVSPVEPTIATVRVEHYKKFTNINGKYYLQENGFQIFEKGRSH